MRVADNIELRNAAASAAADGDMQTVAALSLIGMLPVEPETDEPENGAEPERID
jgi:hypothetical protein